MTAIYVLGILVGLFCIAVAVFNWDSWFSDPHSRVIEALGGEGVVRWYWGIGGLLLIVLVLVYWIRGA